MFWGNFQPLAPPGKNPGYATAEAVKFVRREGEKNSQNPRPLKVVLRRKEDRDLVLSYAHKLNKCVQEQWRKVTVVSDLTRFQRKDEAELRRQAS